MLGLRAASSAPKRVLAANAARVTTCQFLRVRSHLFPGAAKRSISTLLADSKDKLCSGLGTMTDHVIVKGEGSYLYTDEGKQLLDFTTGIAVCNTGHCHPAVVKAIQEQAAKVLHVQCAIAQHDVGLKLANSLVNITKELFDNQPTRVFFWNSGAEAVEAAVKVARKATGRSNIVTFTGGYHGRTILTQGMNKNKTVYAAGFGSMVPGIYAAPFPYCLHCVGKPAEGNCCGEAYRQFEALFAQQTDPQDTACVVIEPVQGEGGYIPVPQEFMTSIRQFCDKHGIMLIIDEVQSGFGRTGTYYASEQINGKPDILVTAKGLASGMPLSAIVTRSELMADMPAGSMGGTYAGNAVACASALATIGVINDDNLLQNANERGKQLRDRCNNLDLPGGMSVDVRGLGLMIGMEFLNARAGFAKEVCMECIANNVLLMPCGRETVRFMPPLTVTEEQIDTALDTLQRAILKLQ